MSIFSKIKKKSESIITAMAYGGRSIFAASTRENLFSSALWSCVINLCRLYATLPWHAYDETDTGGRKVQKDSLLASILHKPNPYMTDYDFRFVMGYNFEMHGEAPCLIQRSRSGLPIALWPVSPSSLVASERDGRLIYTLALDGSSYPAEDVLLIRNTPVGYGLGQVLDPIYYAKDDLDLASRCTQMQKEYYDGASIIGNVVSVPQAMGPDERRQIKAQFDSARGFRNYILDERIKLTPIQVQTADIGKLTEAQKWSATEVARRFNVPPFLVGDTTGTYNNSEQQGLQMVIYCLQPRIGAWESALNDALCKTGEHIKFSLEGLMRGDHATRAAYYQQGLTNGWLTINEIRGKEELPSIGANGDKHFMMTNYGTLDDIIAGKYSSAGSASSVWDLPVDTGSGSEPQSEKEKISLDEKRQRDLAYVAESARPAQSSRSKVEKEIRAQLKEAIAEIRRLIATGSPADAVIRDFSDWMDEHVQDHKETYKAIYVGVLQRMVPIAQKATGKDWPVKDKDLEAYADSYAETLSYRIAGKAKKSAEEGVGQEDFEDRMTTLEQDYPISQSEEETNRSSNAFNLFLFSQLGVTVYHIVAAANSCSMCDAIDGKTASIEGYVLSKDSDLDLGDGDVRHIHKNYRHPPFHEHCRCGVAPGE